MPYLKEIGRGKIYKMAKKKISKTISISLDKETLTLLDKWKGEVRKTRSGLIKALVWKKYGKFI